MKKNRASNILSLLEDRTNEFANNIALGIKTTYGWRELNYNGLGLLSRKLGAYLMNDLGLKRGERLAILSESKPEYGACLFASVMAGLTTVPLDIKLTKYELVSILSDCQPSVMLVSIHYLNTALEIQKDLPSLKHIIVMDDVAEHLEYKTIYTIPNNYHCKWCHRSAKSTVLIIYTSGTTGKPKGVEITFANMLAQLNDLRKEFKKILPIKQGRLLSILPMNHLFEMTVGFSTFMNLGFSVYYTQSLKPKDILNSMKEKKIQFMIVVPAFLKLLKTAIEAEIKNNTTPHYQRVFKVMYHLAKYIPSKRIKKLMFRKVHRYFGGAFRGCMSGGAPLDVAVGEFFQRIGIEIYQGYGLSETSPVASFNTDSFRDLNSVGRPLKSFQVRIDKETGELQLKGPCVMKGYHNQPELTAETIDPDGWLHTGDIAKLHNGHIYITGRIKNMIVLSGGKKVFPEEVEAVLEKSPYFQEVCVVGVSRSFGVKDGTEDIAAVIVPTEELMNQHDDESLEKIIRGEVKQLSMQLSSYKRPINIVISKTPFPRTATRKVKRKDVKELIKA